VAGASLTDAALVARYREHDQAAWAELVERFSRYVYAIAVQGYRLSEADAEEVFQEVFARTYEQLDRLRDDGAIRPWIGQLTRRLAVDRLRAQRRETLAAELEDQPGDAAAMDALHDALDLRVALASLSDACQEILDRFFARDEGYAAIGAALEIPPGTIASRISRCLAKLRAAYEGRAGAPAPSRKV